MRITVETSGGFAGVVAGRLVHELDTDELAEADRTRFCDLVEQVGRHVGGAAAGAGTGPTADTTDTTDTASTTGSAGTGAGARGGVRRPADLLRYRIRVAGSGEEPTELEGDDRTMSRELRQVVDTVRRHGRRVTP